MTLMACRVIPKSIRTQQECEPSLPDIDFIVPAGSSRLDHRQELKAGITAKLQSTGMIEVSQIIDISRIDNANTIQFAGKPIPGIQCYRFQSVNETIAGQPILLSGEIHGLFVFTTVNPKPIDR